MMHYMMNNIPNQLTLLRIGIIPVFIVFFYLPFKWAHIISLILFIIAAITDWLDGYLARRMEQTSAFGAFLDPVADKLMVAVALVLLVDVNPTSVHSIFIAVPAVVIISREIIISALREWMAEIGESAKVAVSVIGKIKTASQMTALILLLFRYPLYGIPTADVGLLALYVAVLLTLWSMVIYVRAAWSVLSNSVDND
jgi:CDP-diacylglycerol--glycerol-3-phosphate 3-phosphatidyltransferase